MGSNDRVGDFVTLQRGITYKGNLVGKPGPALLGLGSITPGGGFREQDFKTYGGDCPENIMLKPGDLFASLKGATKDGKMIGSVARVPTSVPSGRLTQDTVKLELNQSSEELANYIYWILRTPQYRDYCARHATGSAVVALSRDDFLNYPLPQVSPVRTQIVSLLENIEAKIRLNREVNATLEAMAQALFKSWFVDFDPVIDNALAAGNPIPEALQTKAAARQALGDNRKPLPEAIQQQFPSAFEYNDELGWIPEEWKCQSVEESLLINPKVTLRKGTIAKYADMKALPTSGYAINDIFEKEYSGGAKFEAGDILLARITPCLENGKTGVVDFLQDSEVGFGSTEFIVLRSKKSISTSFVACLARDNKFRRHCIQNMVGSSGRQRVQNSCFSSFYLALPDQPFVIEQFAHLTQPSFEQMTHSKLESAVLTSLRDTLLPKLLSGELRIPDAEKLVAEAL